MNILIVGFGGIGCRHAQSFLNEIDSNSLFIVEPNKELYYSNLTRIGATDDSFKWYEKTEDITGQIDFAIIATPSEPRFEIIQRLLKKGIKLFLLEKVVFQSNFQFVRIIEQLEYYNATAYCNFVNRYFPQYRSLKSSLEKYRASIQMHVRGGDFSLGCNGLHYLDLFEYLTNNKSKDYISNLVENKNGNKRGLQYKEIYGTIICRTDRNDCFTMISVPDAHISVQSTISNSSYVYIFDEISCKYEHYNLDTSTIISEELITFPTSKLTHEIFKDMIIGKCLLPTVKQTFNAHSNYFKELNNLFFGRSTDELCCPIT